MNIIDVYIEHHEEGINPELIIVLDDELPRDDDDGWTWDEKLDEESNTYIYYGQRTDGLIRTYWGHHFSLDVPYNTRVQVNGKEVEIQNPAASSCSVMNWFDIGPCINATFVNKDKEPLKLNYYTNITINKCIELLSNYIPNVRLSRKDEGDTEEIPYIIEDLDATVADDETIIYPEQ